MFVLLAIIIGLIIGFIRGGKLKGFKAKKISLLPLGIIGIILQVGLHLYFYSGGIAAIDPFLPVINFVSYILILVMLVFNLDDFWTIMMAVGLTSNFIVTFINGGKMPVAANIIEAVSSTTFATTVSEGTNAVYSMITAPSQTALWFLGINVPVPFLGKITAFIGSPGGLGVGGVVVIIGLMGWIQYVMNRIPSSSAFSKNEPIGELDYIVPPDEDEENDYLFSDKDEEDDDFYTEKDFEMDPISSIEDSFGGMTGRIPKLTPEAIAKIQNGGSDAGIGISILDEYDPSQDTKVFTAINDLGTYEPVDEDSSERSEDINSISGFFTQSFYAEKEKGKLAFEKEAETEIEKTTEVIEEIQVEEIKVEEKQEEEVLEQRIIIDEPVADITMQQPLIEEETPFVVEDDKIISNPAFEETMINTKKKERSEDEMLNIWQKVNQDDRRTRERKRRASRYVDTKEPFKAEREREAAARAVERATAEARARAIANPQPVQKPISAVSQPAVKEVPELIKSAPVAPVAAQELKPSVQPKTAASKVISDEEREKAGFERVHMSVEGREVVFWRKKKD